MEALLDSIRVAITDGASDDERRRSADACRALAQALAGELVAAVPVASPTAAPVPVPPPAGATAPALPGLPAHPFAGMTADQVLDLAIAKLRTAVGDAAPAPLGRPFSVSLVPIPRQP